MPEPVLHPAAESSPRKRKRPRGPSKVEALLALATAVAAAIAWRSAPLLIQHTEGTFSNDINYLRATLKLSLLIVATMVCAYALVPWLAAPIELLRRRWHRAYTALALAAACAFQWAFVVHTGRWQFCGFDYANLIQEGWRESLGQRAYVDFLASTPPAFNLGIKYAFALFGASWDAGLYLTAIFTCLTFLWIYWLFTRLSLSRLASIAVAFSIECAAMLTLSFWWYNNITLILAAILFLSTLLYVAQPRAFAAQLSWVAALALTSLTKPNMAGLTILACVALVMVVSDRRLQALLLALAAAALAIAFLLLNHVSIPALLRSYRAVAGERGFAGIGFSQMNDYEQYTSLCWIPLLSLPLFALLPRIRNQLRTHSWRGIALGLFFFFAPALAAYGTATNGELRQVECTLLLAAGAVVAFGMKLNRPIMARIYITLLFASTVGDLYFGAQRLRVFDAGPHTFFEWEDNHNRVDSGFLKNMRVSGTMIGVERQVGLILQHDPGPYWFGPRLDFNNAVYRLPMPLHLPAWWHPGTAFSRADTPQLIHLWQDQQYQTLIFLRGDPKNDYIYYPQEFLDVIHRDYIADDSHPYVTVFHRRAPPSPKP